LATNLMSSSYAYSSGSAAKSCAMQSSGTRLAFPPQTSKIALNDNSAAGGRK
jgi:hypothetical protein